MQLFSRIRSATLAFLLIAAGFLLLRYSPEAAHGAVLSLKLCGTVLLPALFPFFVLSSLLISVGAEALFSGLLGKPFRILFRLPEICAAPVFLGMLGGYPVGARACAALYQKGRITYGEATHLLCFCNNCGPAFLISAVGGGLLKQPGVGVILFAIHIFSAFLIGFLSRSHQTDGKKVLFMDESNAVPIVPALISAVSEAIPAFLNVCAYVILFGILTALLQQIPVLKDGLFSTFLLGNLEMTCGISRACGTVSDMRILYPMLSFFAGWGGLSVQMQSATLLEAVGLPCRSYLLAKLSQGAIAAGITFMLFSLRLSL